MEGEVLGAAPGLEEEVVFGLVGEGPYDVGDGALDDRADVVFVQCGDQLMGGFL